MLVDTILAVPSDVARLFVSTSPTGAAAPITGTSPANRRSASSTPSAANPLSRRSPPPRLPRPNPSPVAPAIPLYVRLLVRLIEGRPVTLDEVLEMLSRAMRQHPMVRTPWIDQTVTWLHEWPP